MAADLRLQRHGRFPPAAGRPHPEGILHPSAPGRLHSLRLQRPPSQRAGHGGMDAGPGENPETHLRCQIRLRPVRRRIRFHVPEHLLLHSGTLTKQEAEPGPLRGRQLRPRIRSLAQRRPAVAYAARLELQRARHGAGARPLCAHLPGEQARKRAGEFLHELAAPGTPLLL